MRIYYCTHVGGFPAAEAAHLQPPTAVFTVLYFSSSNTVFLNAFPNGYLHSTDYYCIFRFD